jgi:hypothetical protein
MKIFVVAFISFIFFACKQRMSELHKQEAKVNTQPVLDTSIKLIKLVGGSCFRSSWLNQNSDTLIFFDVYMNDYSAPYSKDAFFYDSAKKEFHYTHSLQIKTPPDSFKVFEKNDLLKNVLRFDQKQQNALRKELNGYFKKPLTFLKNDVQIGKFNDKYYAGRHDAPKYIYIIDKTNKSLDSLSLNNSILDIVNFLLHDFDKDNNPELIIFHESMMMREDVLSYDIYSIRKDSIKLFFEPVVENPIKPK